MPQGIAKKALQPTSLPPLRDVRRCRQAWALVIAQKHCSRRRALYDQSRPASKTQRISLHVMGSTTPISPLSAREDSLRS